MDSTLKTANLLNRIARYGLGLIGIIVFMFALVSGAEACGGGWEGFIKNSPNSLPWLTLAVFVVIAWKNELIGGMLATIFGLATFYFFNFSGPNFFIATLVLTALITLLGGLLLVSGYFKKRTSGKR